MRSFNLLQFKGERIPEFLLHKTTGCGSHFQIGIHDFWAFPAEIVADDTVDHLHVKACQAGGCADGRCIGHNLAAPLIYRDLLQRNRESLCRFPCQVCLVNREGGIIDDATPGDDLVGVLFNSHFGQRQQQVHALIVGEYIVVSRTDLVEIVATTDAGVIILQPEDMQSSPYQRFGKTPASGFHPLAGFAANLESHIIYSHCFAPLK